MNKAPAAVQLTAEQLIREAKERELEVIPAPPQQKISNLAELADYKLMKRKEFEDNIRKNRQNISHWLKYADWEEKISEMDRARSIYERALDITGSRTITIWLKYLEMEMKHAQLKHARTLFDRATHILPRANQIWYKYVFFEEALGNLNNCRQVFERWMKFLPKEQEWQTYINFEMRHKEIDRAREIYSKFVMLHPDPKNWVKFARFEERFSNAENARQVYELAMEFFGDNHLDEQLFIAFAQFEERQHEHDRVKMIYEFALEKFPKSKIGPLYESFSTFEKKHGELRDIENLIAHKRKLQYQEALAKNRNDYDTWFDYIRLAEDCFSSDEVRQVYEEAISCQPKEFHKKDSWRRYIFIWIYYACFEELVMKDTERASQIMELCLTLIPHTEFTFAKIWLHAAKLQIRRGDIDECRRILDRSLSTCPKRKLFKEYIELEIQLREFDNCRKLYTAFLKRAPDESSVWMSFAEFEGALCELVRVRMLYEAVINRPNLDAPENVWRAYIDFEIDQEEYGNVEKLYERLLNQVNHVKVWRSYAQFYEDLGDITKARAIFKRANDRLRCEDPVARVALLESWQEFELRQGDRGLDISDKLPKKIKKRKRLEIGDEVDYIEEDEYVFPEHDKNRGLMEKLKRWKEDQQQQQQQKQQAKDEKDN